jgi:NitT/TauT family transport system substrate-binding protein
MTAAPLLGLATRVNAESDAPIRIGTTTSDVNAGALIAEDAGFYKRANVPVTITRFSGAGAVAGAMAGNAIDVGLTDSVVLANAANRGFPIVAIAGAGLYERGRSATVWLTVAKDSPYKVAKDFEGQTIGVVSLESLSGIAVKSWLAKNGADVGKVRFIEMPFSTMPAALKRKTIAGAFMGEPVHSQVVSEVRDITDGFSAIAERQCITEWATTRNWLAQNPEKAKRLVKAVYECARWANEHQDQTAPILMKYAKLDPSKVGAMRRVLYATELTPALIQPQIDAGVRFNAIAQSAAASKLIAEV